MKELECVQEFTGEGMSGSSSNEDAKDVLASIRRVIVDEVRDNPMARPQSSTQSSKPSGAKRLVLGPALRVPSESQFIPGSASDATSSNVVVGSDGHQDDAHADMDAAPNPTKSGVQNMSSTSPAPEAEQAQVQRSKKRRELVRARRKEPAPVAEAPVHTSRQEPVKTRQQAPVSTTAVPV